MRFVLALVVLLLAAPMAAAQSLAPTAPLPREVTAVVVPAATAETTRPATLVEIPAEARAVIEARAADPDMPARGSFWWLVGVVVVAGIILAVLL